VLRQERISNDKKNLLMDSAIKEFSERGYENASYNKIIERSGLSKGTVYYYFENKDSLFKMALNKIMEQFISISDGLDLPETKEEFWEIDSEYHRRIMKFLCESPYSGFIHVLFSNNQKINSEMPEFVEQVLSFRRKLIERGQGLGVVRSDMPAETISNIMQEIGRALSASMIGNTCDCLDKTKMLNDIKSFVEIMRDLGIRIMSPSD
jgi:AcrR family transcriptional regulator